MINFPNVPETTEGMDQNSFDFVKEFHDIDERDLNPFEDWMINEREGQDPSVFEPEESLSEKIKDRIGDTAPDNLDLDSDISTISEDAFELGFDSGVETVMPVGTEPLQQLRDALNTAESETGFEGPKTPSINGLPELSMPDVSFNPFSGLNRSLKIGAVMVFTWLIIREVA